MFAARENRAAHRPLPAAIEPAAFAGVDRARTSRSASSIRNADVAAFFEFIQREGLGKILARPRLVARSGNEAKFLSGGEIPIIIAEALQTSITFKEFGTRLRFKPTVLADDTIDLEVSPEVSEPDFANGVTLFGFQVPAFITRRADTRVRCRTAKVS